MIRSIKNEPVTALMVTAATLAISVAGLYAIMSIIGPNMPVCPEGFVWVDTPQGKGCISDHVWKNMQGRKPNDPLGSRTNPVP